MSEEMNDYVCSEVLDVRIKEDTDMIIFSCRCIFFTIKKIMGYFEIHNFIRIHDAPFIRGSLLEVPPI